MDQTNNVDDLFESINKSTDERKVLYELFQKHEARATSTQNERHQIMLMQNFAKSEILEMVEYYNSFVEFLNSIYILKSSDERDSQEILTWLMAQKHKAFEVLQKFKYNAEQLSDELIKLNSQKQTQLENNQAIAMTMNDTKMMMHQIQLQIEDREKSQKDVDEKLNNLKRENQEYYCSLTKLTEILNQKNEAIKNFELEFNDKVSAAKVSLTNEYKLKLDVIRSENAEIENNWKLERLNVQLKLDEMINIKKDKELNLTMKLEALKAEIEHLNREYKSNSNEVQILHQKNNEMANLEKQLENDVNELQTKLKLIENEITDRKLNHLNHMNKLREVIAGERHKIEVTYHKTLRIEQKLRNKQNKRGTGTIISSSQVTSSSTARLTDNFFDLTSDEQDLDDNKKRVRKTN